MFAKKILVNGYDKIGPAGYTDAIVTCGTLFLYCLMATVVLGGLGLPLFNQFFSFNSRNERWNAQRYSRLKSF
jgi:hypothetical protein